MALPATIHPISPNFTRRSKRLDTERLIRLAQVYTDEALATQVEIMRDREAPHNVRLAAAESILNRGYGKPSADVIMRVQDAPAYDLAELPTHELLRLIADHAHAAANPAPPPEAIDITPAPSSVEDLL